MMKMREKILVVDDEQAILELCVMTLADMGYNVQSVGGGRQALDKLLEERFDLLLTDVKMPDVDGLELLRRAKEVDTEMAVVIITGYGTFEMAIHALRLGASGFLLKPFDVDNLLDSVHAALEKRQLTRENIRLKALLPLFEVSRQLMAEVEPEHIHDLLLTYALRETGADGAMLLVGDKTREWRVCARRGMQWGKMSPAVKKALADWAETSAEALLLGPDSPSPWGEELAAHRFSSALCLPLVVQGQTSAVLSLITMRDSGPLTESSVELLTILGGQAATALENAQLVAQIREWNRELEMRVEERTRELRQAQERLLRAERRATIGQLAASVAHELRNPLGVMRNSAYFLNSRLPDAEEKVRKHLSMLEREVMVSNEIITRLLQFAEMGEPIRRRVELEPLIRDALLHVGMPPEVKTVVDIEKPLPLLMADGHQLWQMFIELLENAVQAMTSVEAAARPVGGRLTVSARLVKGADPAQPRSPDSWPESDWVEIKFADTGVGISGDNVEKVFEPLFTTRAKGIGLGLAIAKIIAEGHGGSIAVDSQLGQGTTLTVRLPINEEGGLL